MCEFSHDAHNSNNRKMADGLAMREREREWDLGSGDGGGEGYVGFYYIT